jgi:hypothetical protein
MTTDPLPVPSRAARARVPRSAVWHCLACGGYQMHDMLITQPLVCTACGAKGLVAAAPQGDMEAPDLPSLGGTG